MTELNKYELMETKYNSLISSGLTEEQAWDELLTNYRTYKYKVRQDSPQDALLLNTTMANQEWLIAKNNEMMKRFSKRIANIF